MPQVGIKILDRDGKVLAAGRDESEVFLVYGFSYREGDRIVVEAEEYPGYYWLQLDDARGSSLVYLTGEMRYEIPFGEKRSNLSPKTFWGDRHLLFVRRAKAFEIGQYRNLALNVWDQHGAANCYPHAFANVETRNEAVFAAMNAIDGVTVTCSHGEWPYESWGINRREDAELTVDFGREVEIDRIVLYTRADFPHDNWWRRATVSFSDDTAVDWEMEKSSHPHSLCLEKKRVSWVKLSRLVKSEEPSPFPALTQIEVYGREPV